jgi:hypothetical protein
MRSRFVVIALTLLGWTVGAGAQVNTATVNGVATDASKAVLPGVTVTATDLQTGRTYTAVTDDRGAYQLVFLPPGTYKVQAELSGFATAQVPKVELLVGQNATIAFPMKLAAVEESVTVTGESPLVDVTSSQIAGNVDRHQMEALPLQGRNWLELSMLVKGITANNITNTPGVSNDAFQLNLDGQEIKQNVISAGQPKFSREAIAEFRIVTNLFDITQGRSTQVQVQAISRSGTNRLSGAVYGFFRDDNFNAPDPIAGRVLPYSNQQAGSALGGPVVRDKIHYFFSYEYERQPATIFTKPSVLGGPSASFDSKTRQNLYLGRVDWQVSPRNALTVRASRADTDNPFSLGGDDYPSRAVRAGQYSTNVVGTWAQIFSNNRVGEVRAGFNRYQQWNYARPEIEGEPDYVFPGANLGRPYNLPWDEGVHNYQFRYDLSWNRGKHDLKIGGEYLRVLDQGLFYVQRYGRMFFTALPSPAEMARRFPIDQWNNPAAWNLAGLDGIVQRFDINYDPGSETIPPWHYDIPRPTFGLWIGDTWRIQNKWTVNLGIRWDDDWGAFAPPEIVENTILINNGRDTGDFGFKKNIRDHNNFAPRVGFTYNVGGSNDFVIRGGTGTYYATPVSNVVYSHQLYNRYVSASFANDGQPGFVTNPTRGITEDAVLSGSVPVPPQSKRILDPNYKTEYTWQSSIGFQKQLGPVMGLESDLVHWKWNNDLRTRDPNLFFDPTTGYNVDPRFGRPNPSYGQIAWIQSIGHRDYLALSTGLTRRLQNNIQAGATHTFMFYQRDDGTTGYTGGTANNEFDRPGEWARSNDFQRNTIRLWTMYQLPRGLSLSAVYFYGSGTQYASFISGTPFGKPGTNRLNTSRPITLPDAVRDRFDGPAVIETGALAPRNALKGTPLHKVDIRIQQDIKLVGVSKIQLMGEVFNLFNHDNFGTFVTQIDNASFGQPRQNLGNAYVPRSGQIGLRFSF